MIFKIILLLLGLILVGMLLFMLLVVRGNVKAMKILAKKGVAVFSGDALKDYELLQFVNAEGLGWLNIPNICYAPVMKDLKGKYTNHNFLQKDSKYGELYKAWSAKAVVLDTIALHNPEGYVFRDLSIIEGSTLGVSTNTRLANFSNLSGLVGYTEDIELVDNGRKRLFNVMAIVEQYIGDGEGFKFKDREDFLRSMTSKATHKLKNNSTNNVILLMSKTDISMLIVLLEEKA